MFPTPAPDDNNGRLVHTSMGPSALNKAFASLGCNANEEERLFAHHP
jgi:hypothetical protein